MKSSDTFGNFYNISDQGIAFIKKYEGFKSNVYNDVAGYPTIGYGHKLTREEIQTDEYANGITEEQATDLMRKDLEPAEQTVNNYVIYSLMHPQYDMLVSFVYNIGAAAFKKSSVLKVLNRYGPNNEFYKNKYMQWVHVNKKPVQGLINRREAELKIFYNGY
jgi:GH24 family phage-related lysozyme (muramidase)